MQNQLDCLKFSFNHYLNLAYEVSKQGTCSRRKIGCIIVDKEGNILAEGFNGRPKSLGNCLEKPCPGANIPAGVGATQKVACYGLHGEIRAMLRFSKLSTIRDIYAIFSTKAPCLSCVITLLETPCEYIVFSIASNETENKELWENQGRYWINE